ncbi:hypothetical protein KY359_04285 [Candidatus Woesearchaeota archaeon]|nr:hypothetical protein [Candidatus Woesearchaeota archaeon]
MEKEKLEKIGRMPFFRRFKEDKDIGALEQDLRNFSGKKDLNLSKTDIEQIIKSLKNKYRPGESVLEVIKHTGSFRYPTIKKFPYPAIFFSKNVIIDLQNMSLNLQRILNPSGVPVSDEILRKIGTAVVRKFRFAESEDIRENLAALTRWIDQKLMLKDVRLMKQEIYDYVRETYGQAVADELVKVSHNLTVSKVIEDIRWRAANLGAGVIPPKQGIFDIAYLKVIYARISPFEGQKVPDNVFESLLSAKEEYDSRKKKFNMNPQWKIFGGKRLNRIEVWNYKEVARTLDIVVAAVKKLHKMYAGHDIVFLARDGLIFYEAYLKMFPGEKDRIHLYYISRQTFNKGKIHSEYVEQEISERLFNKIKDRVLTPAIAKCGLGDVEAVIAECERLWAETMREQGSSKASRDEITLLQEVATELMKYLETCLKSDRVVFVDSSSKTFPVVLSGLCRMFFPRKSFHAFFAVTEYKDDAAGYLIGQKKNFITDYVADMVRYNPALSSAVPYKAEMKLTSPEMQGTSFLARIMLYQRIGI